MSDKIGILYCSIDGQTHKICNFIKDKLQQNNQNVDLFSIDDFNSKISNYKTFVVASSIRYGIHNEKIINFIKAHKKELDATKTAFISVNLVARKPEKNTPETNPYVVKFFKTINWKPTIVEVFAGMLDYQRYKFFDRIMIQFIMWMTKGPTDKNTKIEYTNWEKVAQFSEKLSKL
ncbi:MAG: menaquinone-dependent protoporphyrinogen IX dehydrogenase [Lutibacter sp.]|uniref:menaquinone-dependent protoporphyrinogen IX dehydrogenase n=1 Tax=Lutibacter sp. TaxID=1925666 RepID=UPI00299F1C4A|nr:menaquinone-dependent protoporphyrinogen IX dehydrogenase [Lutibacter sp.]MDX1829688.1 menaquinone-dependent protoporphyrinogen IX dehydrogenase [Lutibacter sp.]